MLARSSLDWKAPNYDPVFVDRLAALERLRADPGLIPSLKLYYKDNPADFISDWGMTFDPRLAEIGKATTIPFCLFPKQVRFVEWLHQLWLNREDGLAEKSRDMGVSWLCVGFAVWMWLFHAGTVIGFGSRKEEYVDKLGDPKSLFWKVRQFINLLPVEFQPHGWDETKHAPSMRIMNPENDSVIVGEAGDNIGRGNRTSLYFKDEAQPLDAKILTPTGWQTMADMYEGALVIGLDGRSHAVKQVKDCGTHDVYRVTMSDGTFAECSPNHLWTVEQVWGSHKTLTLSTAALAETLSYLSPGGQRQYKYRLPERAPVEFDDVSPLPLDPYIVGALLGDGNLVSGTYRICTADIEVVESFRQLLPVGIIIGAYDGRYSYNIVDPNGRGRHGRGSLAKHVMVAAGIAGMSTADKRVPDAYKFASPENRLSLLQGLMDTDGSGSGGVASFHTSTPQLAEDVLFLVQSLGGTATHNVKPDHRKASYLDIHVLHLMLPSGMAPFRLKRKLDALRPRKHPPGRTIISIALNGRRPVRCITVDAPDGLYLTDSCIVTHNSAFYERPDAIDAALSMTSNCKVDVSTPNGAGNPFYRRRHSGKVKVFVFDWRDDPRKSEDWYRQQCDKLDPVIVAQEIDRNYEASVSDAFVPGDIVETAQRRGPADIRAVGGMRIGIDVARFGDDKSVISFRKGRVLIRQAVAVKLDVLAVANWARTEISLLSEPPEQIAVDTIGIGAGVADILRGWYPDQQYRGVARKLVVDVNSSLRMSNGQDYNLRSAMWREMREWLKGASIPRDPDLKSDLTSLRYKYKGGEMLMEDKADAKARGMKSPDRADSLALTFAVPTKVGQEYNSVPSFTNPLPSMGMLG